VRVQLTKMADGLYDDSGTRPSGRRKETGSSSWGANRLDYGP
jgi:hypothetical protein